MKSTKIYIKPITKNLQLEGLDLEKTFKALEYEVKKRIKAQLLQSTFSQRAKAALAKNFEVKYSGSSIRVIAKHPAFFPLIRGQKKGQMKWLVKARAPIPIITETGELIFRSATARSMANGKWIHPGRRANNVIEKARQDAIDWIQKRVARDLKKKIRVLPKSR